MCGSSGAKLLADCTGRKLSKKHVVEHTKNGQVFLCGFPPKRKEKSGSVAEIEKRKKAREAAPEVTSVYRQQMHKDCGGWIVAVATSSEIRLACNKCSQMWEFAFPLFATGYLPCVVPKDWETLPGTMPLHP
jgi:hypothetical protein